MLFIQSRIQCNLLHFLYSCPCPGNLSATLLMTHLTLAVGSSQGRVAGGRSAELTKQRTIQSVLKTAEFNNKGEYSFLKAVKQLFQQIPISKEGPRADQHTFLDYPGCTPSSNRWVIRPFLLLLRGMTWASQMVLVVKNPPANAGNIRNMGSVPRSGRSLVNSNVLAWRIPSTEDSGGLQSTGLQRVRPDWAT